ncbi:hypothetical protein H5410_041032 [Solanum commersonii]|uniref:Uncharacterized protein n=1 Tax=Solanum commersonii TaxID=4109 RepID=A0A9J5XUA1_SOLCO|nr:hypothetical protein H5410_041032 [Solanum commersonii]
MDLGDTSTKSTKLEEVDVPQNFDLLNKWTIPKVPIKTIYDYGWFDKPFSKQLIKTTEESLALNSSEQTIRLPETFLATLRDARNLILEEVDVPQNLDLLNKWTIPKVLKTIYDYGWFDKLSSKQLIKTTEESLALNSFEQTIRLLNERDSLMSSIESTVAYDPIYFNTQHNLQLSLTDVNILDALTLNVKTHGYNYAPGSELISLSYSIYFKLLSTLNPRCRLYDISNQTIFVETNFARSKVTTRRPIKWEEIDFPTSWTLNSVISPNQLTDVVTNSDFCHISQNPDGRICIQFFDNSYVPHRQSFSNNRLMSSVNHGFNRHSSSSRRLMPAIHHISPVELIYGPALDRAASIHTIASDSNSVVEKVRIYPRTNIV